ncbi:DegT/DnrJ/EryC1/StrS aminotransferase family protein [Lagierella sp.]|uniref:DegT/DnrJ/EryC1/StrS family aminotransferase n=1 Tax=Lagierella sp. TaxID=2849657 RepID=UPI0026382DA8|nr:DegT/DnrJ/EryC1/StrS aminotransferase family protein [Lagierella sp.]
MNIQFSPPDITQLEIDEVVDTLKSGWITTGPKTKKLEQLITEYIGTDKTICLNSATAALELNLRLLGIGEGDEVITSAYTYTASASVIDHVGAKIVMVDTVPGTYFMDYEKMESLINENTKAIIPVDIAGVPVDYNRIRMILEKKKNIFRPNNDIQKAMGRVALVSDGAHSFGSVYFDEKTGYYSDFISFSFHAVKNFTTGEGGALSWNSIDGIDDEELYQKLQLLSLHGQSKDALSKMKLGAWEYDVIGPYYKMNMTDIMAAMGLAQFERYDSILQRRKDIVKIYEETFENSPIETLKHIGENYISNCHLYLTRIKGIDEKVRNKIIEEMAKRNIATNVHYKPLPMMTAYKDLGFNINDYPNAFNQYKNQITLPLHSKLTDEEARYVAENFLEIVKKYAK